MKVGDLVKIDYVHGGHPLNDTVALYLGEEQVSDGEHLSGHIHTVTNLKILPIGSSEPRLLDRTMWKHLCLFHLEVVK